jgi:hypothetical protein
MKRFADSLARQKGVKPPPGYKTSILICRAFLNQHAPHRIYPGMRKSMASAIRHRP